ncbi:hypothetical protein XBKB1_2380022 [Xenorhabdus bovienii str. kraussei Becker Underwood]|uniref:Uncharacterized protein n=1 Tax=Xenorhabdus bovienii str. kraussei Becker Underwood TaxID=1398204 RepID=A0A077PTI9_XENBV|nr:hypothetical protein XBKB1_2380022 [Xenorhabdus bovienii str. kraussei Becker Underwood]
MSMLRALSTSEAVRYTLVFLLVLLRGEAAVFIIFTPMRNGMRISMMDDGKTIKYAASSMHTGD